jgi:hypothetical protein
MCGGEDEREILISERVVEAMWEQGKFELSWDVISSPLTY